MVVVYQGAAECVVSDAGAICGSVCSLSAIDITLLEVLELPLHLERRRASGLAYMALAVDLAFPLDDRSTLIFIFVFR
jgi:hypothetical protein